MVFFSLHNERELELDVSDNCEISYFKDNCELTFPYWKQ